MGGGTGHAGPVACGQVPAPPGPTSWPHHSRISRAEKPQPHQKDPTPQLGKPKPTPGLVVGCHGDEKKQPLPNTRSLRESGPLMWLVGGAGGGWGAVLPRKPLLPRAAVRLGHPGQRLPPLSDSSSLPGFDCPWPGGLCTAVQVGVTALIQALPLTSCVVSINHAVVCPAKMLLPNSHCCVKS